MNWQTSHIILVAFIFCLIGYGISILVPWNDPEPLDLSVPDSISVVVSVDTSKLVERYLRGDSVFVAGEWWFPGKDTVVHRFPSRPPVVVDHTDYHTIDSLQAWVDSLKLAVGSRTRWNTVYETFEGQQPYLSYVVHTESFCGVNEAWVSTEVNHGLWFEEVHESVVRKRFEDNLAAQLRKQHWENQLLDMTAYGLAGYELASDRPANALYIIAAREVGYPVIRKVWGWVRN